MLYHTKKLQSFMDKKVNHKWEKAKVDTIGGKTMLIVGFGDIGSACGKIAKHGFGCRVIGVRRRPEKTTEEQRSNADEVVSNNELDKYLPEADFVVGVLPGAEDNLNFFDHSKVFAKMKSSAVFMNIGRGTCINEKDLISAL